jgi:Immunoglobulin-like domain of bacterial spore germination
MSRMRARIAALTVALALACPPAASALTATGVRIGDHPAFVRVVVDFDRGTVNEGEVMLVRGQRIFASGRATVRLARRGVRSTARPVSAHGVRVRIAAARGRMIVRIAARARRLKYVRYDALGSPTRLVIDLLKAAPPNREAAVIDDGCLRLERLIGRPGRVRASGRALEPLFESALALRLRGAGGRVLGTRPLVAARGRWRGSLRYSVTRRARGTFEAVVFSAKDGSLDCLVQAPVTLAPS